MDSTSDPSKFWSYFFSFPSFLRDKVQNINYNVDFFKLSCLQDKLKKFRLSFSYNSNLFDYLSIYFNTHDLLKRRVLFSSSSSALLDVTKLVEEPDTFVAVIVSLVRADRSLLDDRKDRFSPPAWSPSRPICTWWSLWDVGSTGKLTKERRFRKFLLLRGSVVAGWTSFFTAVSDSTVNETTNILSYTWCKK